MWHLRLCSSDRNKNCENKHVIFITGYLELDTIKKNQFRFPTGHLTYFIKILFGAFVYKQINIKQN